MALAGRQRGWGRLTEAAREEAGRFSACSTRPRGASGGGGGRGAEPWRPGAVTGTTPPLPLGTATCSGRAPSRIGQRALLVHAEAHVP